MRLSALVGCFLLFAALAFSQAGNGSITGTVTDPAGAVVANANVEVRNTETAQITTTVTTNTGAYSLPSLQPGPYSLSVTVAGFKKYTRSGLNLAVAQRLGIDIALEVGGTSESVTVSAEASLLKTESGDMAHNITLSQLQNLPILGIGGANAGSSGVRNPFNSTIMIPGVSYTANSSMIVNGAPNNTAAYRLDGLDNTNHTVSFALQENQPSADAIQEVAVQTSNYAAEFGQAGGGLFNITMKSGTNRYSGSVYEYFVNEDLNAAVPFTNDGSGNKVRPRNRRNDFGGTIGGPVWIPKIYNGHDKTFFFFSHETFREASGLNFPVTVPTTAYRNGDFSAISPNGGANFNTGLGVVSTPVGTDSLGRSVLANAIYDPLTRTANSANVFPGNVIPPTRFDPVAVGILKLVPTPASASLTGNYPGFNISKRLSTIPSIKIDHTITAKDKLSFYWSTTGTDSPYSVPNGNADGLPEQVTGARGTFIHSATVRLNYDRTLTPTLLLHIGSGYSRISFIDDSPFTFNGGTFDCKTINLIGCQSNVNFPTIQNLTASTAGAVPAGTAIGPLGGMQQLGNATAHTHTITLRPSFNLNMTWIRGNHTVKGGSEVWFQGNLTAPPSGVNLTFGGATAQPVNLSNNAAQGFPFANFLLGGVTAAQQVAPNNARMGKSQWAFFLQDSWKVTRKLTLDYGVRYDYALANREQYGRSGTLGDVPNPAAGGRIGAPIFEATCNCTFVNNYKYAIGPRLGFAYNLDAKTVIRGGWGIAYSFAPDIGQNSANSQISNPSGINTFLVASAANTLPQPTWPNFSPGQTPLPGQITGYSGFTSLDRSASRPPRQNQWSIGIQREISRDFVVEASWVGNRGVWWSGPLGLINQVSPATFAKFGLNPYTNAADNNLLNSALSSPAVIAKIGNYLPYSGYATSNTLLNALRPYPQFSTITVSNSPTGKTYYDSLQVKGTKRMTHGLQVNGTFTWSKALILTSQDIFSPAGPGKSIQSTDQPFLFTANIVYQTQKWFSNRTVALLTKDWQLGAFLQYASGTPLTPPASTSPNFLGTSEFVRTGQPLYLKDLNCGCINPYTDRVLNPAAWVNPANNTYGPGPSGANNLFYTDFRSARRPQESFNIGRNFRIKERMSFQIRAEFTNILNRLQLGNPVSSAPFSATNAANNPTVVGGKNTGGFGAYTIGSVGTGSVPSFGAAGQLYSQPRQGTLIARFTF